MTDKLSERQIRYARSQAQLGNALREALLHNQEARAVGRQPSTALGFCNRT